MTSTHDLLGIDVGAVSAAAVRLSPAGEVVGSAYIIHHGDLTSALDRLFADLPVSGVRGVAVTGSTPGRVRSDAVYDNQVAAIATVRGRYESVRTLLTVGGETFGALFFDADGNYRRHRSNTSCAAGTGAFLDQQAGRLGLSGIGELAGIAGENQAEIPRIATRCAVFAKTDLIHAQQEGYALPQIADGLAFGLARNIVDTLFTGQPPAPPIRMAGGVALNGAVVKHLSALIGHPVKTDDHAPVFEALGAALCLLADGVGTEVGVRSGPEDLLRRESDASLDHHHPPLALTRSDYPEMGGRESYLFPEGEDDPAVAVEVEIHEPLTAGDAVTAFLGLDVGSTSTKAVLADGDGRVIAGFYTRTAGRPVEATQRTLASVDDFVGRTGISLTVAGAGTTGSGRKLTGAILGADRVIDEITAHARAAVQLRPDADTIIEIGGQDSKFTTLKDGRVTFCVMNTVCAAGTGSFIEEQARRLDCPLSDYARRAEGNPAPLASDRCTVFMERDLNHLLNRGYPPDELLATVLHSVRENYLTKVAAEAAIGRTVLFQGATARNRALVAAFENRLERPIHVSPFCHLTGALGAALAVADDPAEVTRFRGIDLHREEIPIRNEVCELCPNHCKITVAEVGGETAAYGFLCGRDYDTRHFVNNNRSGFDLLKARRRAYAADRADRESAPPRISETVVGLPAALYMAEDLPFWKHFFDDLGIRTVTSEDLENPVKAGRRQTGAELCAPMTALHGHAAHLLDRADLIFLPHYLERRTAERGARRQYCYYTQYAAALASQIAGPEARDRFLTPLTSFIYPEFHTKTQLHGVLRSPFGVKFTEVSAAYDRAVEARESARQRLRGIYAQKTSADDDIHVVLLGRPYTVCSPALNQRIPEIFGSLGVRSFFQDMVPPPTGEAAEALADLLREVHWRFAAEILRAADTAARTPGAYPVYLTAFQCTPDAFVLEYFKRLMAAHDKPYLILQLDDHASSVGYETRIEAAVRAFRNHYETRPGRLAAEPALTHPALRPKTEDDLRDKTLLLPNWDPLAQPLVAANLRREGVDARVLDESEASIRESLRTNTGQCLPLNIVAGELLGYIRRHDLDPGRTVLWMIRSSIACNLGLYAHHIRTLLAEADGGLARTGIYTGGMSFSDISYRLPMEIYFAYQISGLIRRAGCRIRPYEAVAGETDRAVDDSIAELAAAIEAGRSKTEAAEAAVVRLSAIRTIPGPRRPPVAIFGDLYVRDNPVMNQDLVRTVEAHGGEVITTPYSDYVKMVAGPYLKKWLIEGRYLSALSSRAILAAVRHQERHYYGIFGGILGEPMPTYDEDPETILGQYGLRPEHTGESMDNLLKVHYLKKQHPDIALFIQTSPAFCCPGIVTEAMARRIEAHTGTPVASITYDGTGGNKNRAVIPYLVHPRRNRETDPVIPAAERVFQ